MSLLVRFFRDESSEPRYTGQITRKIALEVARAKIQQAPERSGVFVERSNNYVQDGMVSLCIQALAQWFQIPLPDPFAQDTDMGLVILQPTDSILDITPQLDAGDLRRISTFDQTGLVETPEVDFEIRSEPHIILAGRQGRPDQRLFPVRVNFRFSLTRYAAG